MRQDRGPAGPPPRSGGSRIVARFAEVACPPLLRTDQLTDGLLAEFAALLAALPIGMRRLVRAGLVVFDQGARLYPAARGRRFIRLDDAAAEAYFSAVLDMRRSGLAMAAQRIKGLVVLCYYELPQVKEQLGYRPDAYIRAVAQRRIDSYGAAIRAAESALLTDDRGDLDAEGLARQPEAGQ